MGCGNTKAREPQRVSATRPTAAQQNVTRPQFEEAEPELQQYEQNQANTQPISPVIQESAARNSNYDINNGVMNENGRPEVHTTTTNTAINHTMSEHMPSAPCEDLEVVPHEETYEYDHNNGKDNIYASQQPPSVELSEVKITHVETLPEQLQQEPPSLGHINKPAVNNNNNNNNNKSSANINNGERAVGKERTNTIIDENGQEVRLPKGNWFKAQGTEYYYSAIENLYYHPPSKQFYDPTNEMWYDPSTREWYHDDTTEDDSAVMRGQHSAH